MESHTISCMQWLLLFFLASFARLILRIHRPYIIGVTGTVGKTTITNHIARFLTHEFGKHSVEYSIHHYNGEYGLPLTIIGSETGGKNPILWILVFFRAMMRCIRPFPRYLVLEYGIDHPGEMDFLLSIAIPDIAIITEIMPNHIEQFGTFERYREEKLKFVKNTPNLIAHESLREFVEREALFYGRGAMSEIDASHIEIVPEWTQAKVHIHGEVYSLLLPVFGEFQIDNILPVYGTAMILSRPLENISEYAKKFQPDLGRSGILRGIGSSVIVDGSYNGGYMSIHAWLISMRSFLHSHRIIFFLGDMRELWDETEKLHTAIASEICNIFPPQSQVIFYLVGPMMREFVFPKIESHFSSYTYLSSEEAGLSIRSLLDQKSDNSATMVYVKGSQNTIFLEEGIKKFLADPNDVSKLCRQSPDWRARKTIFFDSIHSR